MAATNGKRFLDTPVKERDNRLVCPLGIDWGDAAGKEPDSKMLNVTHATNLADQITGEMSATDKMVFNGDPTTADIVAYTHGMIRHIAQKFFGN